jgi:hypothetical protein
VAALSYQALKRINRDSTKTGKTKDRLAKKLDKEIIANLEDLPEETKEEQEPPP